MVKRTATGIIAGAFFILCIAGWIEARDAWRRIDDLQKQVKTLTDKEKEAENRAGDLQKQIDHYKNGTLPYGLEFQVLSINRAWKFVVLNFGSRQGAVNNAEMILKRGNRRICKVRISSAQTASSVADVIPDSLAPGVWPQVGDRAIFLGYDVPFKR